MVWEAYQALSKVKDFTIWDSQPHCCTYLVTYIAQTNQESSFQLKTNPNNINITEGIQTAWITDTTKKETKVLQEEKQ